MTQAISGIVWIGCLFLALNSSPSLARTFEHLDQRTERTVYSTVGGELFLTHAAAFKSMGVLIKDNFAAEVRHETVTTGFGSWEGRSARLKYFWFGLPVYSTLGIHSYEATIAYDTGEYVEHSWGRGKRYEGRTARSYGPQVSIGGQWHYHHLVLGLEAINFYYPVQYSVEGLDDGKESRSAVDHASNGYRLNWKFHVPQFFVGIAI